MNRPFFFLRRLGTLRNINPLIRLLMTLHRTSHLALLRTLLTISNVVVLTVLIAAVELSIQFNDIPAHVNDLSTSAQVIPLVLSAGFVVRIAYRWISKQAAGDSSSSDDGYGDYYDHSSYYSGQPPLGGPTPPPAAYTG
jgi:hypothetical protein